MGEDATGYEGGLVGEAVYELGHVGEWVEAEAVHAGVELDVYGHVGDACVSGGLNEGLEYAEGVYLGFEVVLEEGLEGAHLGVHDDDGLGDAVAA